MKYFFIILLLVAICPLANAQETEVVRTNVELVQTAVTVLDKNGKFVEGLQREQFELEKVNWPRRLAILSRLLKSQSRLRESPVALSFSFSTICISLLTA
jgi:hypothetical protein